MRKTTLEALAANLVDKPISLEQCVVWARLRFEELSLARTPRHALDTP